MNGKLTWLIVLYLLASIQLAQAQPRIYSVGLLSLGTTITAEVQGLRDGLRAAGYVEGKNLIFDVGVAKTYDELRPVAQSFVEKNFDVIVSTGASAPLIAKQSTKIIPIVFLGEVQAATEHFFGSGPTKARPFEGERLALMPYVTLAAFLPLAFLLWRRNI